MRRLATTAALVLLLAYPRAFRARFGDELRAVFIARLAAARTRGPLAALALALWLSADALVSGMVERARDRVIRLAWPHFRASESPSSSTRSLLMTWDSIAADARLALRQFRRAPVFAMVTVLTLAVGIGANSAIFSVIHPVLLRPLPYANPGGLVAIWSDNTRESTAMYPVSPANFEAFAASPAFGRVEAMYSFLTTAQIRVGDTLEPATASAVTAGMFDLLGRKALAGRTLAAGDDQSVVLSYTYWQRRFGGSQDIVGKPLHLAGSQQPLTIVGVMPDDFVFPYRSMLGTSGFTRATSADHWRLLSRTTEPRLVDAAGDPARTIHFLSVIARLAPGVSADEARSALRAVADKRALDFPDTNRGFGVTLRPLHDQTVGAVRPALLLLLGGVGVLLLMTCLNVANVLLARETGRQGDVAVRAALGASRMRLAQHSVVESVLLALAGGLVGWIFVWAGRGSLVSLAPSELPRLTETSTIWLVLGFTMVLALATGVVAGAVPALASSRTKAERAIHQSRRTTASAGRRRVRAGLVVAQLALATMLTGAAGVLLRSFVAVLDVDPGFQPRGLLTFQISVPTRIPPGVGVVTFYDDLTSRLSTLPGVEHVGGSTRIPLGSTQVTTLLTVEGRDVAPADLPEVEMRRSVGDYFAAMNIPVLKGRAFTPADRTATEGLAIINAALADRVFPNENPIGRRVRMGSNPQARWLTIVGTVGSVKHSSLEETPRPEIYISHYQGPPSSPFMALRTAGDPAAQAPAVRRVLAELGADPPYNVRTMDDLRRQSVGERRFVLVLVGLFGVLALVLATAGVYGVIALVVSERTAEVGVRLALGATPSGVLSLVVGQAIRLAALGILAGVAGSALLTRAIATQLFGVSPLDPATFAAVIAMLAGVAIAAALVPARRAMTIDPAEALRA